MHAVKPGFVYAIVTLTVAIPLSKAEPGEVPTYSSYDDARACDGINDFLNGQIMEHGSEALIHDWAIENIDFRVSRQDPQEGELVRT